jgi:tripartite-type tricarboxylate transporter receptor subunit TctC
MGGRISVIVDSFAGLRGAIDGGTVKVLAVTATQRLPDFPDLPTVAEVLPGFAASGWYALMAPTGTPDQIVQKVSRDLRVVLGQPEVQEKIRKLGAYVRPTSPAETAAFIRSEQQLWTPLVKQLLVAAQ